VAARVAYDGVLTHQGDAAGAAVSWRSRALAAAAGFDSEVCDDQAAVSRAFRRAAAALEPAEVEGGLTRPDSSVLPHWNPLPPSATPGRQLRSDMCTVR
jgi:hypothetical protein